MTQGFPYCGLPPVPGALLGRFNDDPVLIVLLCLFAAAHIVAIVDDRGRRAAAIAGWLVAAVALISPLCALSVALFSARVGQHMILLLIAAPLIAISAPAGLYRARLLWPAVIGFFLALWFWHMPLAYDATFRSTAIYWAMHLSLFGTAVALWAMLLAHARDQAVAALAAGIVTSIQMGLLGAILTFSSHAWFAPHYDTVQPWGFTPLSDQQLGGVLMWVPGCGLFLLVALRSARHLWQLLEPAQAGRA
jgi:putative membrane protein